MMRPSTALRFFLALVVAHAPLAPAMAQDSPREPSQMSWFLMPAGIEGQPIGARTHFFYDVYPGQILQDALLLVNPTGRTINFRIYPADGYALPPEGTMALRSEEEEQQGVGSWVDLQFREVTLEPGMQAEIPFALHVPLQAEPGDHAGGIVALNIDPEEQMDQGDLRLGLRRAIGVRIYPRVDGSLHPGLEIRNLRVEKDVPLIPYLLGRGKAVVTYDVVNTGNIRIRPQANVAITGFFGRTLTQVDAQAMPELLPRGMATKTVELDTLPVLDRLTISIRAVAEGGLEAEAVARAWIIPWLLIVVLASIVAAWIWLRRHRRRAAAEPSSEAVATPTRVGA